MSWKNTEKNEFFISQYIFHTEYGVILEKKIMNVLTSYVAAYTAVSSILSPVPQGPAVFLGLSACAAEEPGKACTDLAKGKSAV